METVERPRSGNKELGVAREVVEGDALAGRPDLRADRREPRRRHEVVADLRLHVARLEPVRALPAGRLSERRARRPERLVQRHPSHAARRPRLLRRPVQLVQPTQGLDRPLPQERPPVHPATHPRDIDLGQVHGRMALHDPFGRSPTDTRPEDDPLRVETGGHEQAVQLRHEPELEVGVGREALRRPQVLREPDRREFRYALPGRGEDRCEVLPVRPELREARPRDRGRSDRPAVGLKGSDDVPPAVVADVQVPVQVAEERQRLVGAGGLLGHDPHVFGGIEGHARAGQAGQLAGP